MKPYVLYTFIFALLIAHGSAMAEEQGNEPLEFGHIEIPPFGYTDSEGNSRGHLIRLTRQVFAQMGLSPRFQSYPAARLYRLLRSGKTAFTLGAAKLHALREVAYESQESTATLALTIYHRQESPAIANLKGLKGKRVALIRGYSYGPVGKYFEEHSDAMTIEYALNQESALNMLTYKRVDYLLNYQKPTENLIAQKGITDLKGTVIGRTSVHFFVSREVKNAESIRDAWDRELRNLKKLDKIPAFQLHE